MASVVADRTSRATTADAIEADLADLWRDVNTIRSLAHRSWNSHTVMPRFVLEGGRLYGTTTFGASCTAVRASRNASSSSLRRT